MPVSSLVTMTVTPGRTAPPESTTLPPSADVPCWANTDAAHSKRLPAATITRARIFAPPARNRTDEANLADGPLVQLGTIAPGLTMSRSFRVEEGSFDTRRTLLL